VRKAESLEATVVEAFVERGESGTTANRPALKRMLARLTAGDIQYVVVHKIDRLARNRADDVAIVMAIRQAGATLVSVSENIDETPSGLLLHGIMSSIAEFYSQNLGLEVKKGTTQKALQGGTPFLAPVGYLNVPELVDGREIRTIAIDPERGPLVTEAFVLYATAQYALSELAAILESRGLKSRPGRGRDAKPLSVNRLAKLLRNRYYIGTVEYAGKTYQGRHTPLIDPITFQTVQAVLDAKRKSGERSWRNHNYLRGSIYCAACGGRLFFTRVKGRNEYYDYYVCRGRQEGTCAQPNHRVEAVEAKIEEHYASVTVPVERREAIRTMIIAHVGQIQAVASGEVKEARAAEARLNRQERKLLDAHYADRISDALFQEESTRIQRERVAALKLVESLEAPYEEALRNLDLALDLLDDMQSAYIAATDKQRRLFNQAIFKRIWIDNEDVSDSTLAEPFEELLDDEVVGGEWGEPTKLAGIPPRVAVARDRESVSAELSLVGATAGRMGPETARTPAEGFFRGGSHVESMVRMRGLEPPRSYLHTDLNRPRGV
jgi:DNA invertase Pin-like site-specific DNA recombinase